MVFAVNSDESGPNNFAAFQALAKQLNGTTSTSTNTTTPGSNASSGVANGIGGSGLVVALAAALFGLVL
jgi:hypothetical protein